MFSFEATQDDSAVVLLSDSDTVQNQNVFKHDPGIAGLVVDASGTPVPGVNVQILDAAGVVKANLVTDENGFYMWVYKYTGKPTSFTVKLPDKGTEYSIAFKSNGFAVIIFHLAGEDADGNPVAGWVEVYSK
jgi:uncharacterized protein YfaS (alpha-2-macroglobulin family)